MSRKIVARHVGVQTWCLNSHVGRRFLLLLSSREFLLVRQQRPCHVVRLGVSVKTAVTPTLWSSQGDLKLSLLPSAGQKYCRCCSHTLPESRT
ncbi:hypothetical protein VUR80DRAFT_6692 [Thermomyces stellatus]